MSEENTTTVEAPIVAKDVRKKKAATSKVYPKKLGKKVKSPDNEFEFSGRIDSINIKGTGANSNQFLFSLIDKKGAHNSYLLDPAEPLRFSAMADLLTAASVSGTKVKIRSIPNVGGPNFAAEVEIRVKS